MRLSVLMVGSIVMWIRLWLVLRISIGEAVLLSSFFFQAEDGIRDGHVTGVQTCALPILGNSAHAIGQPATPNLLPGLILARRGDRRRQEDHPQESLHNHRPSPNSSIIPGPASSAPIARSRVGDYDSHERQTWPDHR